MSRRIIIEYDDVEPSVAINRVLCVMSDGRISEANGIPHYCWYTSWPDRIGVLTRRKRSESSADSFLVRKEIA